MAGKKRVSHTSFFGAVQARAVSASMTIIEIAKCQKSVPIPMRATKRPKVTVEARIVAGRRSP